MSTANLIESHREGAEVYHGAEQCKKKSVELLREFNLPTGLLPMQLEEIGYNRAAGFLWVCQKNPSTHLFKKASRLTSYAAEVTAFMEDRRMKKMTGVKSKEFVIWIDISDIFIDDPEGKNITFMTPAGLYRAFPISAFQAEEQDAGEEEDKKENKEEKKKEKASASASTSEKKEKKAQAN